MVAIKNIKTLWNKNDNGEIEHKYALTVECPICGEEHTVEVFAQDYFNWNSLGMHTQDAFPYLSDNEREMLISGVCPTCWEQMFGSDEDEDYDEEPADIDDDCGFDPYMGCFTGDC